MTAISLEKIEAKLRFLTETIAQLETYQKIPKAEYLTDQRTELAVERLFQVGLEAVIDSARLLIIEKQLEKSTDLRFEFEILAGEKFINPELASRLAAAKRFRNLLVHHYAAVETEQVYRNLQENLDDLKAFTREIAKAITKDNA